MTGETATLKRWVSESREIVFFGGAGVSTESGIPDFRSTDGLYHQEYDDPPEIILSHTYFQQNPLKFFQFYRKKMLCLDAQPNEAHRKLAQWEREGKLRAVITQNIDGLHQKAGSRNVLELHGSVLRNHCMRCGAFYEVEAITGSQGVPHCHYGGIIKPDVVLYEEGLGQEVLARSVEAISRAEMLVIGGTSLSVYPAAGLIRYFRGDRLVVINKSALSGTQADLTISAPIGQVLGQL